MYTLIHNDRRVHFLAMPRTASKACRDALREAGAVLSVSHHGLDLSIIEPDDLVLSTIRNHWDWFVSFWYLNGCPGRFDRFVPKLCRESEWIERNHDGTKCRLYWKYAPHSTIILRYERVERDLNAALESHGFPTLTLKREGKQKPKPYQIYYKQGTVKFIESRFQEEIDHYGYSF